jgi:hypothetical protein
LIITLSSIPPRFGHLRPTLDSLLRQRLPAERIILYVPEFYRRFPEWDGCLPQVPEGVEIHRTDKDLGPATKVLPAVREFAGEDIDILFCDDDVEYDRDWTRRFAELRKAMPRACIAEAGKDIFDIKSRPPDRLPRMVRERRTFLHRLWRKSGFIESGYCDILHGVGGAIVRPDFFPDTAFEIPEILWTVDDVWLSGQLEAKGIPIWLNADAPRRRERRNRDIAALRKMVHEGRGRTAANRDGVEYLRKTWGIWEKAHALRDLTRA